MSVKGDGVYHKPGDKQVPPESFAAIWSRVCAKHKSKGAIYSGEGTILRSFEQIEAEREDWHKRLAGFAPNSAVVAQLGNHPGWPAFFLAAIDRNLVVVPAEADLSKRQLQRIFDLTHAAAAIESSGIRRLDNDSVHWPDPRPDMLKITSGTTGLPRAVSVRAEHLIADCRNICQNMGIGEEDINFGVIPFSHSYGFSNLITPLLVQGTTLVCTSDRMPRAVCEQIASSGATVFPGTPTLFQALASLPENASFGRIRLCISAGAPLPTEVSRLFFGRFFLRIHSFYGSSECGGIAYDREGELHRPTGFVGTPMSGVQITRLTDDRISVAGPNVADGYFPESDPATLQTGRFVPADLIRWSGEAMQVYGRASDFINVAGKKFHPSVVEEHLRSFPGVVDAIVFAVPSLARNEDLIAYIAGDVLLSRGELEAHCRAGLNSWEVPRDFLIRKQLPVDTRGKVSRAELARRYQQGLLDN